MIDTITISLGAIQPSDYPRNESQNLVADIWGQLGPPTPIIDLTNKKLGIHLVEIDGIYLVKNGNNRLLYLYDRCGSDQLVNVLYMPQRELKDIIVTISRSSITKLHEKGIRSFSDLGRYRSASENEYWLRRFGVARESDFSPFMNVERW